MSVREFWTDGSTVPNPGRGGFAVVEVYDGVVKPVVLGRARVNTTNVRMEGYALIHAMKRAGDEPCEIHTDSNLWVQTVTRWAPEWARNKWHKRDEIKYDSVGEVKGYKKTKIKNLDIVKKMYELYKPRTMKLVWEKSHAGTEYNELADKWANKARKGARLE